MSPEPSSADPRISLTYRPSSCHGREDVELRSRFLVVSDFTPALPSSLACAEGTWIHPRNADKILAGVAEDRRRALKDLCDCAETKAFGTRIDLVCCTREELEWSIADALSPTTSDLERFLRDALQKNEPFAAVVTDMELGADDADRALLAALSGMVSRHGAVFLACSSTPDLDGGEWPNIGLFPTGPEGPGSFAFAFALAKNRAQHGWDVRLDRPRLSAAVMTGRLAHTAHAVVTDENGLRPQGLADVEKGLRDWLERCLQPGADAMGRPRGPLLTEFQVRVDQEDADWLVELHVKPCRFSAQTPAELSALIRVARP